jgi:hypothetical protein
MMAANLSPEVAAMSSRLFQCRDCGSFNGYRSRPQTFVEKFLLPLFLLRTVRCGDCFHRSAHLITVQVQERRESKSARVTANG